MYTKIIPPPALNHQGGWDEMLMFLVPALLLTWLRNKQKNENTDENIGLQGGCGNLTLQNEYTAGTSTREASPTPDQACREKSEEERQVP